MDAIQEKLDRMIREDCLAHEERLRVWVEAAEDMERAGEDHREVLDMLFWVQVEFRRRRTYLGLEESDLERWAAALLRRLWGGRGCGNGDGGTDCHVGLVLFINGI